MHVPGTGAQMAKLEKGFVHEGRADAFKLVPRGLPGDALTDGLGVEQVGDAFGNRLAGADHTCTVDGQGCLQQCRMKRLAGVQKPGHHRHHAAAL